MKSALAVVVVGLLAATPALAQDISVFGGAALVFDMQLEDAGGENTLQFQPYVEAEVSHFYAGVWLSLEKDTVAQEVDLYLGYRNETPTGLSYDFNYTRYLYPNDGGNCCGEFGLSLGAPMGDSVSLSVEAYYDPDASVGTASVGADYALSDKLSLGAAVGVTDNGNEREWEVGATYYVTDEAYVDLHYYDGSDYTGYLELTLSYDTTLFSR